jgi:hypothetical protein
MRRRQVNLRPREGCNEAKQDGGQDRNQECRPRREPVFSFKQEPCRMVPYSTSTVPVIVLMLRAVVVTDPHEYCTVLYCTVLFCLYTSAEGCGGGGGQGGEGSTGILYCTVLSVYLC